MRRHSFLLLAAGVLLTAGCSGALQSGRPAETLEIVTRATWQANEPVAPMKAHTITRITIHHTATRHNPAKTLEAKLQDLQRFSQNEGALAGGGTKPAWPDVPYHYYIDVSGRIGEARDARYAGDTNTSYDPAGHLLIVLEGNFEEEQPTPAQLETLRRFVGWQAQLYGVPAERIQGHKDFAQTACPGTSLYAYLPELRKVVQ